MGQVTRNHFQNSFDELKYYLHNEQINNAIYCNNHSVRVAGLHTEKFHTRSTKPRPFMYVIRKCYHKYILIAFYYFNIEC